MTGATNFNRAMYSVMLSSPRELVCGQSRRLKAGRVGGELLPARDRRFRFNRRGGTGFAAGRGDRNRQRRSGFRFDWQRLQRTRHRERHDGLRTRIMSIIGSGASFRNGMPDFRSGCRIVSQLDAGRRDVIAGIVEHRFAQHDIFPRLCENIFSASLRKRRSCIRL
jgi:hypothetical protein